MFTIEQLQEIKKQRDLLLKGAITRVSELQTLIIETVNHILEFDFENDLMCELDSLVLSFNLYSTEISNINYFLDIEYYFPYYGTVSLSYKINKFIKNNKMTEELNDILDILSDNMRELEVNVERWNQSNC